MKTIKTGIILLTALFIGVSCDPIENESLRDKYYKNAGEPITKAELEKATSVIQPFPNLDGAVKGDQYVVVKNTRTDIPGAWHISWGDDFRNKITTSTDSDTIICTENSYYQVYFVGLSAHTAVQTDPVYLNVTNVFDEWDNLLTGAENKADKTAKKTWRFREVDWGSVCNMGAHGGWRPANGHNPESKNAWWASYTYAQAGDQRMVFEYDGKKFKTYNADGTLKEEGVFSYNHELPDADAVGTLTTTVPTIGGNWDECGQRSGVDNVFWLLRLEEQYMTIFHPNNPNNPVDWDDYGWYAYFEKVTEADE